MITVFLQFYFKLFHFQLFQDLLRFIANRANKEWEYIFRKGRIYEDEDAERGDLYVKEIVGNLTEEQADKHDPYVIDDRIYRFVRIPFIVEAVHLETSINGLKTLHTSGICSVSRIVGNLDVNASLGAGPLDFSSDILVKSAYLKTLLTIKVSLNYCKVHANFSIDARTGKNGSLQSVCIDELGGVSFSIMGLGMWLYIPSLIVTIFMKLLKRLVRNIVEFKLEQHVREVLPNHQFPIEGTILGDISFSDYTLVDDSSESDMESFKDGESSNEHPTFVSENLPKHTTKLRKPIWCTNLHLFEDIEEPEMCYDEYDESDMSIQFQFSKDKVVQEEIEPLTRPERPTCCVFFRTEAVQFSSKTSELFKNSSTEVAGYEDLKREKMHKTSKLGVQFDDFSPVKDNKDIWELLTLDESPRSLDLSGSEGTTIPCNPKDTDGEIDKLIEKFHVAYPKFIAFSRHDEEMDESRSSNEQCAVEADINLSIYPSNTLFATINDKRDSGNVEVDPPILINKFEMCTPIKNAGELSEAKYLELDETKTAFERQTVDCGNLCKDTLILSKTSHDNEDSKHDIAQNFKQLFKELDSVSENENFTKQSECLLDKTGAKIPVGYSSVGAIKTPKDLVESILKWDDVDTEEMCALKSENIGVSRKTRSEKSPSSLTDICFENSRQLTSADSKTEKYGNTDKTILRLKMPPGESEQNNNTIKSSVKCHTAWAMERLDFIGDLVFSCYDTADNLHTNHPVSTYFPDSLSTDFSQHDSMDFGSNIFEQIALLEDGSSRNNRQDARKDSSTERFQFQFEEINDNISNIESTFGSMRSTWESKISEKAKDELKLLFKDTPLTTSEKIRPNLSVESFIENNRFSSFIDKPVAEHLLKPLKESDEQTQDEEKGCTPVDEELMTEIYKADNESVSDYGNIDDDYFLDWICDSDDPSVDVSSDSEEEGVNVENSILCKEFTYTKCVESETKLTDPVKGIEKKERLSSVSEKSLLNSLFLNNETFNPTKDSLNDSNDETILQETRNSVVNIDIQINVNIDAPNIDSPVRLDQESTDCSIGSIPESLKLGFEAGSGRESDIDMKTTESDKMSAQTSKKESSIEPCDYTQTESLERCSHKSLHDEYSYLLPKYDLIKAQGVKFETVNEKCKASSLPKPKELCDESSLEDRRSITMFELNPVEHHLSTMVERLYKFQSNESYEELLNDYNKTDILNDFDVNKSETDSLREASVDLDLNYASGCTLFSEEFPDESLKNLLPLLAENTANSGLALKASEQLEKRPTSICSENSTEPIENSIPDDVEEMETLKPNTEEVSLDKEQANDEL